MINNISMHFCMSFLPFSLRVFHYVVPVPLWFFVMILASFVPVPRFSVRHPQILKRGINTVHPQNGFYVLPLWQTGSL